MSGHNLASQVASTLPAIVLHYIWQHIFSQQRDTRETHGCIPRIVHKSHALVCWWGLVPVDFTRTIQASDIPSSSEVMWRITVNGWHKISEKRSLYRWLSAGLQYLQRVCNGDTAALHLAIICYLKIVSVLDGLYSQCQHISIQDV